MRLSSASALLITIATVCLLIAPGASQAAGMDPPYFIIQPTLQSTDTKKIEVAEVFSYACGHCAQFQPKIDAWRKTLNTTKVEFVYLAAPYEVVDTLLARGYFAAQMLGLADKTHHEMFEAIHTRGYRVRSFDDLVNLYSQLGVPADKFTKAAKDFLVDTRLRQTYDLMLKYKIDSTPTLIVAGKYRITADTAGSHEAMIKVADSLIAQELALPSATSRQAPKSGK